MCDLKAHTHTKKTNPQECVHREQKNSKCKYTERMRYYGKQVFEQKATKLKPGGAKIHIITEHEIWKIKCQKCNL